MRFYVSKCHNKLNGREFSPELVSPDICLNPYYPVRIDGGIRPNIILDSGAFQDVATDSRLNFEEALQRQLDFEEKNLEGLEVEAIVSYDRLVDEQLDMVNGQIKKRVSHRLGKRFVEETVDAAEFLSKNRKRLGKRKLVLSCQGTTAPMYLDCVERVLSISNPEDIIGFGGFCIVSKGGFYERQYYRIIKKAIPMIAEAGNKRVHIFGLGMFRALTQTDIYARMHGIEASYDTSSPELNATFGKVFNPTNPALNQVYRKSHKKRGYHPADLAIFNIKMMRLFWEEHEEMALPKRFSPSYKPRKG